MILEPGEKVHIIMRRNFENDPRRHFIGEIVEADEQVVKVKGRAVIFDSVNIQYEVKPDARIRIISLTDARNIINIIPHENKIDNIKYVMSPEKKLVVTDG